MDLHSDYPYWMIRTGLIRSFPTLTTDLKTDVLIVGGGITAALVGDKLARSGISMTIVDKAHIGHGSTSASTAILQYEIDTPLFELTKIVGKATAERSYHLCAEAIDRIGKLAQSTPDNSDFEFHPSLYFSASPRHLKELIIPEYKARKNAGLEVDLLDSKQINSRFGFDSPGGILSAKAAHLNPYKLCHYLFEKIEKKGNQIFSHTEVKSWKKIGKHYEAITATGLSISCKYIVIACGYESQSYLDKKVTNFDSTYAIVSLPLKEKICWENQAILWNTTDPYLYMRTTVDNRIIVGGRDSEFSSAKKRDAAVRTKSQRLEADFKKLFPDIPFQTDFAWAGTFGKTKDGLPYIGPYNDPSILYAMGYGGNGITFSLVAADILCNSILGGKNPDAALFSFDR